MGCPILIQLAEEPPSNGRGLLVLYEFLFTRFFLTAKKRRESQRKEVH
jgi:hypothetical protein